MVLCKTQWKKLISQNSGIWKTAVVFAVFPGWTVHVRDASTGLDEHDADRVVIDVPDIVSVLSSATAALRDGGILVGFSPSILQVKDIHEAAIASGSLGFAETFEVLERSWHIEPVSVRPDHRMVAHTGFITVMRRLAR